MSLPKLCPYLFAEATETDSNTPLVRIANFFFTAGDSRLSYCPILSKYFIASAIIPFSSTVLSSATLDNSKASFKPKSSSLSTRSSLDLSIKSFIILRSSPTFVLSPLTISSWRRSSTSPSPQHSPSRVFCLPSSNLPFWSSSESSSRLCSQLICVASTGVTLLPILSASTRNRACFFPPCSV